MEPPSKKTKYAQTWLDEYRQVFKGIPLDFAYHKNRYGLYKKNLKHFYIIHPTWWSKLATWFFTTFAATDIKHKVHSLKGVQYLYSVMSPDQIDIPNFVQEYDIKVNGPRYVVPDPDTAEGL